MRQVDGKLYDGVQRDPDPADYSRRTRSQTARIPAWLWVSGLNSPDMRSANSLSARTTTGKPALRLLSFDDDRMLKIKGQDGEPLYSTKP